MELFYGEIGGVELSGMLPNRLSAAGRRGGAAGVVRPSGLQPREDCAQRRKAACFARL